MRAFIAIDVPPFSAPVAPELRPEDHLTLQFFEELPVDRVPDVVAALVEAATSTGPFDLEIRGVGAFPSVQRPRVLWAGVGSGSAIVQSLTHRVRQGLAARGFPTESRPFVPHLTLGRIWSPREAVWARRFLVDPENVDRLWVRAPVSELRLMESELLPTGARHTVRERVELGTGSRPPSGP